MDTAAPTVVLDPEMNRREPPTVPIACSRSVTVKIAGNAKTAKTTSSPKRPLGTRDRSHGQAGQPASSSTSVKIGGLGRRSLLSLRTLYALEEKEGL
jgi:hypothetical protein